MANAFSKYVFFLELRVTKNIFLGFLPDPPSVESTNIFNLQGRGLSGLPHRIRDFLGKNVANAFSETRFLWNWGWPKKFSRTSSVLHRVHRLWSPKENSFNLGDAFQDHPSRSRFLGKNAASAFSKIRFFSETEGDLKNFSPFSSEFAESGVKNHFFTKREPSGPPLAFATFLGKNAANAFSETGLLKLRAAKMFFGFFRFALIGSESAVSEVKSTFLF